MSHQQILRAIDDEIRRLQQVRRLLQGAGGSKLGGEVGGGKRTRRTLSPEARERIAAAQRRRWAKQKKADAR